MNRLRSCMILKVKQSQANAVQDTNAPKMAGIESTNQAAIVKH